MTKKQISNDFDWDLKFVFWNFISGGLAQLARALDLHSRGQGFDSPILHTIEVEGKKEKVISKKNWGNSHF